MQRGADLMRRSLRLVSMVPLIAALHGAAINGATAFDNPLAPCTQPSRRIVLPLALREGVAPQTAALANGDIEAGAQAWQIRSNAGFKVIYSVSDPDWQRVLPAVALEPTVGGQYALWFRACTGRDESSWAAQTITIPATATVLRFSALPISREEKNGAMCPENDVARVAIDGVEVYKEALCEVVDAEGNPILVWTRKTVDITTYAGKTVTVRVGLDADDQVPSNWLVDTIAIE
jgi:hypothetical protein